MPRPTYHLNYLFRISLFTLLAPLLLTAQQGKTRLETRFIPHSKIAVNSPYLRFDPFTVNDSLISRAFEKKMVLRDKEGYLWFLGDEKLVRYDGNYSREFAAEPYLGLQQAADTTLYAITGKGIAIFNQVKQRFESYEAPGIDGLIHWKSCSEYKGKIYTSFHAILPKLSSVLFEFDLDTRQFSRLNPGRLVNGFTRNTEPGSSIYMNKLFTTDKEGNIWGQVACNNESALGYYNPKQNELVWFPLEDARCMQFIGMKRPHQSLDMSWLYMEPEGSYVWTGGWWHTGLLRLNLQNLTWTQYYFAHLPFNKAEGFLPFGRDHFLIQSEGGMYVFDKKKESVSVYNHLPDNSNSPPPAPPHEMAQEESAIWIGGPVGHPFSILDTNRQYFRSIPDAMRALGMERAIYKKNTRLLYTFRDTRQQGLAEYDEATGKNEILYVEPYNRLVGFFMAHTVYDSINQYEWIGGSTYYGGMFGRRQGRGKPEIVKEKIEGASFMTHQIGEIQGLVRTPDHNIWFATGMMDITLLNQGHLIRYDARKRRFKAFLEGAHGLPARMRIRTILCDSRGLIWIGYHDGSIAWFDPVSEKVVFRKTLGPAVSNIIKIQEDKIRNVIWVTANDNGLWQYNPVADSWKQVLKEPVINLVVTLDGTLFLKTYHHIIKFNPDKGVLRRLGREYDMTQFQYGAFTRADDDEIYFDKFRFYPRDIPDEGAKPEIVLSFVKVLDKELELPGGADKTSRLDFSYDQNFFSVGFSLLSWFHPENHRYAYKLEGFNTDWISTSQEPVAIFTNVPPNTYRLRVKGADADGVWSDERAIDIVITPPWWQTWWFRTLAVLLLTAILYTVYRYRLHQLTLKSRLEAETARYRQREAELSRQVAETEIAALRAQMNPHFIFNCLNSIQYYMARNEPDIASEYLTSFSQLIRLVLENSRSEKVSLDKELEALRLYLDMEVMRFQDKVTYHIDIAPDVDTETIEVPPLLIQPFAENAIWHGLMHKEDGGRVLVEVWQNSDGMLCIVITDDGIGRQKAGELKSKSAVKRKSFGIKVTNKRIAMINQIYQTRAQVKVTDLEDSEGKPAGTRVKVKIQI